MDKRIYVFIIMNNLTIIENVEKIAQPYFKFNIEDFYGDRGNCKYPTIEDLKTLFFKLDGKNKKTIISKDMQQKIVDEIINLNIGTVEITTINSFGRYIVITPFHADTMNLVYEDYII